MGFSAGNLIFFLCPALAENCAEIDSNDPTLAIISKNMSQINRAAKIDKTRANIYFSYKLRQDRKQSLKLSLLGKTYLC